MAEQGSVVPVGVVRERVIQTLTEAFANDLITVAELEDRLEKVYRATTAEEAEALIAGLRRSAPPPPGSSGASLESPGARLERDRQRVVSIMSAQSRRGIWTVPRELDVFALFSDTVIDLSQASLPSDIVELHVKVLFASLRVVVPAGTRVVNRVGAFAANVESEPALDLAPMVPGSPVIRISGTAAFANLEIVAGPAAR
ncbi:MAG TPA: DUF1707 domain-containing protein [Gemmatimonadaceae bacterium]|nr:DUF1707 domain-containing protein [Gemmatimonadaceae bacterium]